MLLTSRKSLIVRKHGASVPGGFATWDPAASGSNVTLTGGNLIAKTSNITTQNSAALIRTHATGKYYFEITWTGGTPATSWIAGLQNGGYPNNFVVGQFSGGNGPAWAAPAGTPLTPVGSQVINGDVCGVAIDLTNHFIWTRCTTNPNWNSNPSADPTTPSGGADISGALPGGTGNWGFLILISDSTSQFATLNAGQSAYSFTSPTLFGNW